MRCRRIKGRSGFTLIEILLAFAILLIGVLGVMALFPVGMRLSKKMTEESTAALVARNARGVMEATKLADAISPKDVNGIPTGLKDGDWPHARYFPQDFPQGIVTAFLNAISNSTMSPPIKGRLRADGNGIVDTADEQYSWDARFDLGRGALRTPWLGNSAQDQANAETWRQEIFSKYFRYYAVQISVYRNYHKEDLPSGTVTVEPATGYVMSDPNRPLVCKLTLSSVLPAKVTQGWYIRVNEDRSDWYQIQKIDFPNPNNPVLYLDRVYAGATGAKTDIIATDRLLGEFTTLLAAYKD